MKFTGKQEVFIREYLIDRNGTRAAVAAGYAEKSAPVTASVLLRNHKVMAEITKHVTKRNEKLEITADYVLGTIKETVERCRQAEEVRDKEGNPTGEYRFEPQAVMKGCELLGKHLELFTEKVKHSGSIETVDMSRLSDEQLGTIEHILTQANGRTHAA